MNTSATSRCPRHWLESADLLNTALVEQACSDAAQLQQSVVQYLVAQQMLDSRQAALSASAAFGLPVLNLEAVDLQSLPLSAISSALIRKHHILPIHKTPDRLLLALSDPAIEAGINEIKFHTSCRVELVVVEETKLQATILTLLDNLPDGIHPQSELEYLDFTAITPDIEDDNQASATVDETPVMRFVNKILLDAIRLRASDVHIEQYEQHARIRFREDGQLREISRPPLQVTKKIVARLKVMASLDISEKRLPQDGRFKLTLSRTRSIDFRISTLPTLWGEKTVLRVLDTQANHLDINALGFSEDQKQVYLDALNSRQGLILVTGPTGSGKSRTLYAGLSHLNTRDKNIASVEDPVEIHLDGVNQVAVNAGCGLDFAEALRAFMRQDPDVIMVGEVRDLETAQITIRAALTGHLVLSTLHTNSAAETLTRLSDMGIAPFQLATALRLIIAQRLLRRLCNSCKKPVHLPRNLLIQEGFLPEQLVSAKFYEAQGCEKCVAGYKGQVGLFEMVPITDSLCRDIIAGKNSIEIADLAAKAGFNTLRISALEKAALGLTSLTEVNRIT